MSTPTVAVIGAGMGGLAAALSLAARGAAVTVYDRAAGPGGKMREIEVGGLRVDAGPTVVTMRWIFEELFAEAGLNLADAVTISPATVLARHFWPDGGQFDLYADEARTLDAITSFAGPRDAEGYRRFRTHAQMIFDTLDASFIRRPRPRLSEIMLRGPMWNVLRLNPYISLAQALKSYFRDPRLRQLFGRYATYCGSSPLSAPATLMLVADVERRGVGLVAGGVRRLALALEAAARQRGVTFRYEVDIEEIRCEKNRATGLQLRGGAFEPASAVICNADAGALAAGAFGKVAARGAPRVARSQRSQSAITFALAASVEGRTLSRHNVFFSDDATAEFDDVFKHRRYPENPSVYVCAQDADAGEGAGADGTPAASGDRRPLLCVINAPSDGDKTKTRDEEIERCATRTFSLMSRCGVTARTAPGEMIATSPSDFAEMFPGTGGALYGQNAHGWRASFRRPGVRSPIRGLYLAGGSVHPGPGAPMAALSGRMAAQALWTDFASI